MQTRVSGVVTFALWTAAATSLYAQPLGSEFRANSYTTGLQMSAAVAGLSASFVVVWESQGQDGSSYGIYGQRFTSAPKPARLGGEFRVNTSTTGSQRYPAVASASDGSYVVVWESVSLDNTDSQVMAQRYDASGAPVGSEFRVNTYTTTVGGVRRFPTIASDALGNFVIAWNPYGQDGEFYGIVAQRFTRSGAPLGGEFNVNTTTAYNQIHPSAAFAGNGSSFVIAWQHASPSDVRAQRYSSSGAPLGGEFRVNTYTTNQQDSPSVAADSAGNFTVAWRSSNFDNSFSYGVHAQRYASSGAPLGTEFRVDTGTGTTQASPKVSSDANGNLTVAWTDYDAFAHGILARRYAPTGVPLSGAFPVNSFQNLDQANPAVANVGEPFVVVWRSNNATNDSFEVFGKRYPGPGDINGDGFVNVADVFYLINYLFAAGAAPVGPADTNGDGAVNVADVFYLINYLFAGGTFPK
jgi:hypothetical protein